MHNAVIRICYRHSWSHSAEVTMDVRELIGCSGCEFVITTCNDKYKKKSCFFVAVVVRKY